MQVDSLSANSVTDPVLKTISSEANANKRFCLGAGARGSLPNQIFEAVACALRGSSVTVGSGERAFTVIPRAETRILAPFRTVPLTAAVA